MEKLRYRSIGIASIRSARSSDSYFKSANPLRATNGQTLGRLLTQLEHMYFEFKNKESERRVKAGDTFGIHAIIRLNYLQIRVACLISGVRLEEALKHLSRAGTYEL